MRLKRESRTKRGLINWVGSELRVLFGTMDADDVDKIKEILDTIENNESNIKEDMINNLLTLKKEVLREKLTKSLAKSKNLEILRTSMRNGRVSKSIMKNFIQKFPIKSE